MLVGGNMSLYERLKDIFIWYKATDNYKSFDESVNYKFTDYESILNIVDSLYKGDYKFGIPKIGKVKKDDGTHRDVIILEDQDRVIMRALNIALNIECRNLIHPSTVAYKEYVSVSKVVKSSRNKSDWQVKLDVKKYFNSVSYNHIEKLLDKISNINKEDTGIMNCLKDFFKDNRVYVDNELAEYNKGLCQGSAISSFLANALLYNIDKYFSEHYSLYYRYSDDILIGDKFCKDVDETNETIEEAINKLSNMLSEFGLAINDKKTKIYLDGNYDFLGYNVAGNRITLSKHRSDKIKRKLKAIRLKIQNKSITYCRDSQKRYIKSILRYLGKSNKDYPSVLRTIFSTINSVRCLGEIDKYFIQQIQTIYTGRNNYTRNSRCTSIDMLPELGYVSICELYKMFKFNYEYFIEFENNLK